MRTTQGWRGQAARSRHGITYDRSPDACPSQWRDRPRRGGVPMIRRLVLAALAATIVVALSASAAFAGELTGNGRKLLTFEGSKWGTGLHARSLCAYSGQEDLQFFQDEGTDQVPVENPVKGVPN